MSSEIVWKVRRDKLIVSFSTRGSDSSVEFRVSGDRLFIVPPNDYLSGTQGGHSHTVLLNNPTNNYEISAYPSRFKKLNKGAWKGICKHHIKKRILSFDSKRLSIFLTYPSGPIIFHLTHSSVIPWCMLRAHFESPG